MKDECLTAKRSNVYKNHTAKTHSTPSGSHLHFAIRGYKYGTPSESADGTARVAAADADEWASASQRIETRMRTDFCPLVMIIMWLGYRAFPAVAEE